MAFHAGSSGPGDGTLTAPARRLERYVAVPDGGPAAYLRGRLPDDAAARSAAPILCVHGATFPGHATFDLALDGLSWLGALAARGRPAYCLDLPGYGLAERPPAMDGPPSDAPPVTPSTQAAAAVMAAAEDICAFTGAGRVDLLGWSWGTTLCAMVAARRPDLVRRLVLYGPQWFYEAPHLLASENTAVPAYRLVTMAAVRRRRLRGVPPAERASLVPPDWLASSEAALMASDPRALEQNPPAIRAPNGTIADALETWCAGVAPYNPAAVRAPCLLVVGEWDRETTPTQAHGLFAALSGASTRRLLVLGRAGHWMLLDRRRGELLAVVTGFLDEPDA